MKMRSALIALSGIASANEGLDAAMAAYDVRSSWEDGFQIYAQMLMADTSGGGLCATLNTCVTEMEKYFEKIIQDDKTNTYVTLAWCAQTSDSHPDVNGNTWWYDGYDTGNGIEDKPYYIVDAVVAGMTSPCGNLGMIMRGIEVDNSISIYAAPDYIHTKWDISHKPEGKPQFDYTPAANCNDVPENTYGCARGNPCGKADEMYELWHTNVKYQLYGNEPHMVLTMCQKMPNGGAGWNDDAMKDPTFVVGDVLQFAAVKQFAPLDYSNTIDDHIEWDKAPKDQPSLGEGEGWEPFKFSQCCTTLVIAPQI